MANIGAQNIGPMSIASIQKQSDTELIGEKKNKSIFNNILGKKLSAYDFKLAAGQQVGEMSTNSLLQ